jgi:VNT family MFS transporter (synaptic vesicle glycoprotein 2)
MVREEENDDAFDGMEIPSPLHRKREGDEGSLSPPPLRSLDDFLQGAAESGRRGRYDGRSRPSLPPWRYHLVFLSLGVANSSDAAEILCLSYILSNEAFQQRILRQEEWRGGLLAATVFAGMLLGGLLVGCLGDWWGRRPLLLVGLTTNCVAGFLSSVAGSVFSLALIRFVAGIGIGATVPPLFALCSELAPPRDRGFWVVVAASFWMVGSLYVALVGWWILGGPAEGGGGSGWRLFAAVCAVPAAAGCWLVYRHVPESPRFLLLQRQHDNALQVIDELADKMNYTGPAMTREELVHQFPVTTTEQYGLTTTVQQARGSFSNVLGTALRDFQISASQLYTPQLRSTTYPLQVIWFSLNFGSYGLLTWINTLFVEVHLRNVYFNALLFALSNLPGNLLSAALMDRTGRAPLLSGSVFAAALSLVSFAVQAGKDDVSTTIIVVSACAFQCFIIAAWNAIDVLTSELFPTAVRSTGMGVCAATGRVGAMLAQLVNGALVARPARLLLTAAAALLAGCLSPAMLPPDKTGRAVQDAVIPAVATAGDVERDGADRMRRSGTAVAGISLENITSQPPYYQRVSPQQM